MTTFLRLRHQPSPVQALRGVSALLAGVFCFGLGALPANAAPPAKLDYNRHVKPILAKNCFACHGPDDEHREGGVRLDLREAALAKGESGALPVVPGKSSHSEVWKRISATDDGEKMPPPATGNTLTSDQAAVLKRWIDEGAEYAPHWSFVAPVRPQPPQVKRADWPANPIDRFILAELEAAGLAPAEEADKRTLARRASLDLRGLPPTIAEVDAFLADSSPDAYEKLVDRFLADPAFGERWARMWLDQARYADSRGYGSDPLRVIWRYRDWVVDAFNRNQPFDQFTVDQLAGDLLENPTLEQRVATAFHRNTMTNTEGGTDDEEFRVAAVKDRIDVTLQVWMGLTIGCAKCHNHKFDPLSQKEYYQAYAIFNQTADNDQPSESPVLEAPSPGAVDELRRIDAQVAAARQTLQEQTEKLGPQREAWEASLRDETGWKTLHAAEVRAEPAGPKFETQSDGTILASERSSGGVEYIVEAALPAGAGPTALRLETLPGAPLPQGGAGFADDGNFVLSRVAATVLPAKAGAPLLARYVRVELPGKARMLSLAEVEVESAGKNAALQGAATQSSTDYDGPAGKAADGNTSGEYHEAKSTTHTKQEDDPWWEVDLKAPAPISEVVVWNRTDGGAAIGGRLAGYRVRLLDDARNVVWTSDKAPLPSPEARLAVSGERSVRLVKATSDFTQKGFSTDDVLAAEAAPKKGWSVAKQQAKPHQLVLLPEGPVQLAPGERLQVRLVQRYQDAKYTLGRFRLSASSSPAWTRRTQLPFEVSNALDVAAEQRSAAQKNLVLQAFQEASPELKPLREALAKLEASRPKPPTVPVMEELPVARRRKTHLMQKGNFLAPGEEVSAALPAAFHPLAEAAPVDRKALASWIVDPKNPLTARVAANRFWSQLYGIGLVETEEDFGTQGELPSHPELLDWLATEFIRLKWDVKAFLKTILLSKSYRQASTVTPEALAADPRNRLLSRAPRFRLEAEMIRDQALAASGLLSRRMYGPSVFPPQPEGLWQAAFNGERTWQTSPGEDRWRRGIYVFWRRTVPYPSMAAFDAPSRENCTVRRIRTNTPLQALVTLNDPVYVEAAQALGRRMVREGGSSLEERLAFGWKLATTKPATEAQVQSLSALWKKTQARYAEDSGAALKLATDPLGPLPKDLFPSPADAAAWTLVGNVLLNLDAVLTRN